MLSTYRTFDVGNKIVVNENYTKYIEIENIWGKP